MHSRGLPTSVSASGGVRYRRGGARQRAATFRSRSTLLLLLLLLCVGAAFLLAWRSLLSPPPAPRPPPFCGSPQPLVCAHGGDTTAGAMANTAAAYVAALDNPAVNCVEVDVSRARDTALVALHTRQLLALAGGEFERVGDARLAQLLELGEGDRRVLTFEQALASLAGKGLAAITVDIKDGPPLGSAGLAADVGRMVNAANCSECVVWSRDDAVVAELVAATSIRVGGGGAAVGFVLMNETAASRRDGMHRFPRPRVVGASALAAHWPLVTPRLVKAAAAKGVRVFGWTANEEHMTDPMVTAGAFGIVTDDPAMVAGRVAVLRAVCPAV